MDKVSLTQQTDTYTELTIATLALNNKVACNKLAVKHQS